MLTASSYTIYYPFEKVNDTMMALAPMLVVDDVYIGPYLSSLQRRARSAKIPLG
jgi:hypothetical protein